MRIRVDDDLLRGELADALDEAGCETRTIGLTLDVVHLEAPGDPLELRFFVRAWHARHPGALVEIVA